MPINLLAIKIDKFLEKKNNHTKLNYQTKQVENRKVEQPYMY